MNTIINRNWTENGKSPCVRHKGRMGSGQAKIRMYEISFCLFYTAHENIRRLANQISMPKLWT